MQGIPLSNFHVVDGLSSGLGLGLEGAAGPGGGGGIEIVEREILRAVDGAKGGGKGRVVLVLDGLDFLVAAMGVTAREMGDLVGSVREVCWSRFRFYFRFSRTLSLLLLLFMMFLNRQAHTFLVLSARPFNHHNRLR